MMTRETAERQVRQAAICAAWHNGGKAPSFKEVRKMVPRDVPDAFLRDAAERAGFPVGEAEKR